MKSLLLTLALTMFGLEASASGDHFHPKKFAKCKDKECTEQELKEALPNSIAYLNEWQKIDLTWAKATVEKAEKKQFKKAVEWMFTLVVSSPIVQKRYVFFTLDGYVTGSNSTGE